MKKIAVVLSMLCLLTFCAFPCRASANEITVSAAMSLKNAFEEIGKICEAKYPNTKIRFNFGASGDLVRQIEGGAPVDVFAAAAQKDMDIIASKGFIWPGTRTDIADNRVVLVTAKNSNIRSFEELATSMVRRIAAGNPKTVPAGRYAAEVFDHYKIAQAIKDKLIYGENVRQVLDYVARGEVDAGVVYSTDAAVRSSEVRVAAVAPESSHKPVIYPIAIVKGTKNENAARSFIASVRSAEGKAVLRKYGFLIP